MVEIKVRKDNVFRAAILHFGIFYEIIQSYQFIIINLRITLKTNLP